MNQDKKIFGIGLNKTGTKTLGRYLRDLGYSHRTYDSNDTVSSPSFDLFARGDLEGLLSLLDGYDSCEDWPWPVLYKELDERYPNARFVLTVRESADAWYRSLCNMAVRIGPLALYEKHIYGWAMPQGDRTEMMAFYERHNREVTSHFADRPGKLVTLCWERGDTGNDLARFLGHSDVSLQNVRVNPSPGGVYSGDNLMLAHLHRLAYQHVLRPDSLPRRLVGGVRKLVS